VPMPKPTGTAITLSPFRRPTPDSALVEAKAGCLYPNNARALTEARARGFDNCLSCDALGNVAELATANIFMAKDGVVFTPVANGTFLAGITRARVIALLRQGGANVMEKTLRYADFQSADEIFSTGNYTKVSPVTRIDDRQLQPGPFYRKARELYWEYAHTDSA
jgi:branched-chain amino acid aminotransferase